MANKTDTIITVVVLIIVAIAVIYIMRNFKSIQDFFKGISDAGANFTKSLQDGLAALDKSLGDTEKGVSDWWQQFYNNTLNKPLVPLSPPITKTDLNKMTDSTSGAEVPKGSPSTSTSGSDGTTTVTTKQTNDQKSQTSDSTPADLKPSKQIQINLIDSVSIKSQQVIQARATADATSSANQKASPTDPNLRAASIATNTNPPRSDVNTPDPTKIPNPLGQPQQGTIFDNLLHDLDGLLAPLAAVNPIARPISPVIEVP